MSFDQNPPHYRQPPGQQQPQYAQPYPVQQPPKKRKKWPWIVGGIVLFSILACVGVFTLFLSGTAKVAGDLDDNQKGKNAAVGQMNQPTRDGKFEFTVTGMQCGLDKIGGEFGKKAQGEFCLVSVTIKNVATTAETFLDSTQQATDAKGAVYSVDSGAGIFANGDSSVWLEQINPGSTVKGKLVFDVAAGTKLTTVVLHESTFTAGVKVPLK